MTELQNNTIKINKIPIKKIRVEHFISERDFLEKQLICASTFEIERCVLENLLLLHPVVVNENFELIGGINSYVEWRKFVYLNPLDKEQKFHVLVTSKTLSDTEKKLMLDSEFLYQELFLSKYFRSPQTLLETSQNNIQKIKRYKPSLVKENMTINVSSFSKEFGLKSIRTKRNSSS